MSNVKRESLIKILLFLESERVNGNFSDRELNIIKLLYMRGGVSSSRDMDMFVDECYSRLYTRTKSTQSVRNVLTKARSFNFIKRKASNDWRVSIIPTFDSENLVVKCLLTDYAVN